MKCVKYNGGVINLEHVIKIVYGYDDTVRVHYIKLFYNTNDMDDRCIYPSYIPYRDIKIRDKALKIINELMETKEI